MTLIRFTLQQRYLNVDMVNVFTYFKPAAPINNLALQEYADDFENKIIDNMNVLQLTDVTNISLAASRLDAPHISLSRSLTGGGTIVPASAAVKEPSWFAVGVRLNVGDTFDSEDLGAPVAHHVRRGYKFVGGISEDQVSGGHFDPTVNLVNWATFLGMLAQPVQTLAGSVSAFLPCVVSVYPGTSLPAPAFSTLQAYVDSAVVRDVTSLRSRKR